ncbi:MAG: hypothetical protein ACRD3O_12625, partial [Terriglobia bacterium]
MCTAAPAQTGAAPQSGLRTLAVWNQLPPPPLMRGIGDATLKITTRSPAAQSYFNQGLRLLHCFWYFEAYRAFREAARLDPSAPMAYWGIAESLSNFPAMQDEAAVAIQKAESLMNLASDHERYYIRAAADLTETPGNAGRDGYVREMQALIEKYPGDLNAPAFLAFFVMSGYEPDGRPTPGEVYAQTLLRRILRLDPGNVAANHYWIHAVEDGPAPQEGLKSVQLLLRVAPNSGHLVHMAGHIYFRLGDYEKARQYFLQSMRVDERYMAREHIPPDDDADYEHNLSYLVAACAEAGRYREALRWAEKLDKLAASPAWGASALNYEIPVGSTLMRLHLRFADWQAAAHDPIDFGVDPAEFNPPARDYQNAWHAYARGMAALERDPTKLSLEQARAEAGRLLDMMRGLSVYASRETGPASFWTGGAVHLLDVASTELDGNLKAAQGEETEGFRLLTAATQKERDLGYTEPPYYARPVEETLGDVYLKAHDWSLARQVFGQELRIRPQSGFALFGIARSYGLEGRTGAAIRAYEAFLDAWTNAD